MNDKINFNIVGKVWAKLDTSEKVFFVSAFIFLGFATPQDVLDKAGEIVCCLYSIFVLSNKILPIILKLIEWRAEMNLSKNQESPPKEKTPADADAENN